MPLLFIEFCELLSTLEKISRHDPPYLPAQVRQKYQDTVQSWFASYKVSIHSPGVDPTVLLSALYPAKRTDRVYNIQAMSLSRKLRRSLQLGIGRWPELERWQQSGNGDLSECVERVLKQAEFPRPLSCNRVLLENVDDALARIASRCRFSGPRARPSATDDDAENPDILGRVYQRLHSREAKWFTRMILKDYSCLDLDKYRNLIYSYIDPRLPIALQVYDGFEPAVAALKALPVLKMSESGHGDWAQQCMRDAYLLAPQIGVKVGSPRWAKANGGVKHAVSMIDGRTMSVERKYDGEYCQIHVDLSKEADCMQIFSKSGKDSTRDREGVGASIKNSLRIGRNDCSFRRNCIMEGELVIWSDRDKQILDFHKIRKHVSRSGTFLGAEKDSPPHSYEHLMIVFYDVLMIDDDPILHRPYSQRRRALEEIVTHIQGRACITQREKVCFSDIKGPETLKKALANAFALRWEGLVLKPYDEPYFNIRNGHQRYPSQWIKLKKDCIHGLGDTADFAVVGGGYDAKRANELGLPNMLWTHFFIGCLTNKHAALHSLAKPEYLVIDCVTNCINIADFQALNQHGSFVAIDAHEDEAAEIYELHFASLDLRLPKFHTIFRKPFVFDIAGSGFEKGPNRSIFTFRFPRVMKIRWDRDWKDCVDLPELQAMADEARRVPTGDLGEEIAVWVNNLNQIDKALKTQREDWDLTDEEEAEQGAVDFHTSIRYPYPAIRNGRSKKREAPPLVRIDTSEMRTEERRMSTGAVVERPTSKHSTASDGTLPTPTRSSSRVVLPIQSSGTPPRKRKQCSMLENELIDDQITKRPKLQHQITDSINVGEIGKLRSLQEITNGAPPIAQPRASASRTSMSPPSDELKMVRKMPVGAQGTAHSKRCKPTNFVDLSSQAKETTTGKSSSQLTTQNTETQDLVSSRVTCPTKLVARANTLITPPNTEEAPPRLEMPILPYCNVLQGSSLGPQYPTEKESLARHSIKLIPFTACLPESGSRTCRSKRKVEKNTVLIIDTRSPEAACEDLVAIASHLGLQQYWNVTVWDIEILLPYAGKPSPGQDLRRESPKHFCAQFSWVEDRAGEAGSIRIQWRDGGVDVVTMRHVESLRRIARHQT